MQNIKTDSNTFFYHLMICCNSLKIWRPAVRRNIHGGIIEGDQKSISGEWGLEGQKLTVCILSKCVFVSARAIILKTPIRRWSDFSSNLPGKCPWKGTCVKSSERKAGGEINQNGEILNWHYTFTGIVTNVMVIQIYVINMVTKNKGHVVTGQMFILVHNVLKRPARYVFQS